MAADEPSDEQLVSAWVAHRDPEAITTLVARHSDRVYGLAFRFMGNEADAADAAQEVFIRLMRKAKKFQGRSAFSTWLYRLSANVCKDELRKRKRRPHPTDEIEPDAPPAGDPATNIDVEEALQTLPTEQRVPLVLRVFEDLSYEQIAEATEVPIGTVKSRIARGRVALAEALEEPRTSSSRPRGKT